MSSNLLQKVPYQLYYTVLTELKDNNLKINKLKGFKYQSINEALLWRNILIEMPSVKSIVFYYALDEINFLIRENLRHLSSTRESYNMLSVRILILGFILRENDIKMFLDENSTIPKEIIGLFLLAIEYYVDFSSQLYNDDFTGAYSNFSGIARAARNSMCLLEKKYKGESFLQKISTIEDSHVLEQFFSSFNYVKKSVFNIVLDREDSIEPLEILSFEKELIWITSYGESSLPTFLLVEKSSRKKSIFLESLRIVIKSNQSKRRGYEKNVFKRSIISSLSYQNDEDSDYNVAKAHSIIFNSNLGIDKILKLFWVDFNVKSIEDISYRIKERVTECFSEFKIKSSADTAEKQYEAYYLLFSNLYETILSELVDTNLLTDTIMTEDEVSKIAKEIQKCIIDVAQGE